MKGRIAILCLFAALEGCSAYSGPNPRVLPDYQADPGYRDGARDAENDWQDGVRRFAAIATGSGMMVPPLRRGVFDRCYGKNFGLRVVDRQAEMVGSGGMRSGGSAAVQYATAYNEVVLRHLGPTTCAE
jgi:hypothetical protein